MTKNMGKPDRIIRTALAVLVGVLYFSGVISGFAAIVMGIFAIIFLLTSFVGFCPLYAAFNFSTKSTG